MHSFKVALTVMCFIAGSSAYAGTHQYVTDSAPIAIEKAHYTCLVFRDPNYYDSYIIGLVHTECKIVDRTESSSRTSGLVNKTTITEGATTRRVSISAQVEDGPIERVSRREVYPEEVYKSREVYRNGRYEVVSVPYIPPTRFGACKERARELEAAAQSTRKYNCARKRTQLDDRAVGE